MKANSAKLNTYTQRHKHTQQPLRQILEVHQFIRVIEQRRRLEQGRVNEGAINANGEISAICI